MSARRTRALAAAAAIMTAAVLSTAPPLVERVSGLDARRPPSTSATAQTVTPAAAPAATPVPAFGAVLDRRGFRYARPLAPGPAGVTQLDLDAAVLAHSEAPGHTLYDLRLADAAGRQVPYLLERLPSPLEHPMGTPGRRSANDGGAASAMTTVYEIELPFATLPPSHLVVTTSARVFTRQVSLVVERAPDARHRDAWTERLASQPWTHADDAIAAPPLRVAVPSLPGTRLRLHVDEGDNQPLPLQTVTLELPAYRLRFLRPADTALDLLYGHPRLGAPRYDVADLVRSPMTASAAVTMSPERTLEPPPEPALVTPPVFRAVLGVATVVLLGLLVRLMRATPARDAAGDPPASP